MGAATWTMITYSRAPHAVAAAMSPAGPRSIGTPRCASTASPPRTPRPQRRHRQDQIRMRQRQLPETSDGPRPPPALPFGSSSAARSTDRTWSAGSTHAKLPAGPRGPAAGLRPGLRSPGAPSQAGWPGLALTASGQRCSAAPPLPLAARAPAVSVAVEGASGADLCLQGADRVRCLPVTQQRVDQLVGADRLAAMQRQQGRATLGL